MITLWYIFTAGVFSFDIVTLGWQLVVNGRQPTTADLFWMVVFGVNYSVANSDRNSAA